MSGLKPVDTQLTERDAWLALFRSASGDAGAAIQQSGDWFFRRDVVIKALQTVVGDIGGHLDGTGTRHASYELIRHLELGEATAPEQLRAALALRLLQPDTTETDIYARDLHLLRCCIDVYRKDSTSSQFKAHGIDPKEIPELLRAAIIAIQAELYEALKTRVHGDH